MGSRHVVWLAAVWWPCVLAGCGGEVTVASTTSTGGAAGQAGATSTTGSGASSSTGGTGAMGGTVSTGTAGSGGATCPAVEVACGNKVLACGDAVDNDGDGLVDSLDPDCMGPCDNTEDAYYGGVPGRVGPPCFVDCYWDADSGPGNDDCYWSHECDPNEMGSPGHPESSAQCPYDENASIPSTLAGCADLQAAQSDACAAFCMPLVPNGCDCFGCCELPAGSGKFVWFGSSDEATGEYGCTAAVVDDPDKCEPCTPVPSCYNPCETCELCVGKAKLPPECTGPDGTLSPACPDGLKRCGLDCQDPCPAGTYCITGCCRPTPSP